MLEEEWIGLRERAIEAMHLVTQIGLNRQFGMGVRWLV